MARAEPSAMRFLSDSQQAKRAEDRAPEVDGRHELENIFCRPAGPLVDKVHRGSFWGFQNPKQFLGVQSVRFLSLFEHLRLKCIHSEILSSAGSSSIHYTIGSASLVQPKPNPSKTSGR